MDDEIKTFFARNEERKTGVDHIGNFESQFCDRRWESPLYYPIVNDMMFRQDPSWPDEITWPGGKSFAACLTHDVDTVQINSRSELLRKILLHMHDSEDYAEKLKHFLSFVGLRKKPVNLDIFSPWIQVESHFGFHSTFFFSSPAIVKKSRRDNVYHWNSKTYYRGQNCSVRDLMKDLSEKGWSVGLHGSVLSASDYDSLCRQKEDIEKTAGHEIYSIRNHNLQYDVTVTPYIQEKAGFLVDSTLGFNRDIGFRTGIAYPHRVWDMKSQSWIGLVECPLIIQDGALLRNDNLDLDENAAFEICRKIIDRVISTKGVITILWHPDVIIKLSWWNLYKRILAYIHEKNGWGASVEEIYNWWKGQGMLSRLEKTLEKIDYSGFPKT